MRWVQWKANGALEGNSLVLSLLLSPPQVRYVIINFTITTIITITINIIINIIISTRAGK